MKRQTILRSGISYTTTAFAIGLLILSTAAAQGFGTLLPVDEAASRPDFFAFRAQLQGAVAKHDVAAILNVLDPNIRNSFGGDGGIEEFKGMWRINDEDSPLWGELGVVLALGGTFGGPESFVAPYTFSRWPDQIDSFEHVAVIGTNVRIRTAPSVNAAILAIASHSILRVDVEARNSKGWTAVKLKDGRKGYIAAQFIRSPIDYRAMFSRSSGRWRMTFFVAGD